MWDINNYGLVSHLLYETCRKSPYELFRLNQKGEAFQLTSEGKINVFREYLNSSVKQWECPLKSAYFEEVVPLAINDHDDIVAFMPKGLENRVFFLPWIPKAKVELREAIVEVCYGAIHSLEQVEEWVHSYNVPTLNNIIIEINKRRESIQALEKEKREFEQGKEHLETIRNTLLYRFGIPLQSTVKEVLNYLGLDTKDGPNGREDITFVCNGKHFVVEVKGLEKSLGGKHIDQLQEKKTLYEKESRTRSKGILVVNAWRKLPLELRGSSEYPVFSPQIKDIVETWEFALLTTQQLFVAYCKKIEGTFDLDDFINKIYSTSWIVEGYGEINNYKTEPK